MNAVGVEKWIESPQKCFYIEKISSLIIIFHTLASILAYSAHHQIKLITMEEEMSEA